ncbi:hypothetical protein [Aequorivita echinoideorum]|uniref:Uncharacterized protein n=1 Tax=Aequorivita echinoideorum TaxID=1549647 RepID=A0ABS5S387_9FLAO|nr:hypothetical protein [Aequorivita echinoideorum]MBT0607663.1 hypothetical protein [Aequorivita echinoideorum]
MIYFQSEQFELNLLAFGVSLNEENDIFTDSINKSYSLPFTIKADNAILEKLGLPTLDDITDVNSKIPGRLKLPSSHYSANLFLGEVFGDNLECKITFGEATLPVYETKLKDLPWPIILAGDLRQHAKNRIDQQWPLLGYNFPMVYNPKIKEESNYDLFEGFVNNYANGEFLQNEIDTSGEENVYINRNVMVPFPYLLEILKFGYKTAGLKAVGEIFQDETLKKAVYMPEKFLEKLDGSQYLQFAFTSRTRMETASNIMYNVYERSFVPENDGTYNLAFTINLDPTLAKYFRLEILRENALSGTLTTLERYYSTENRVQLDEKLDIEVTPANEQDPILVRLTLLYTNRSISDFNNFEFSFSDGQLNVFPTSFSLRDFMPDMTFGEYVNKLKNWLNLEIVPQETAVMINFLQKNILNRAKRSHRHLEVIPKKQTNSNRFYKLNYANDERVFYTKDGQIYSDLDDEGSDIVIIDMGVQPAIVESNKGVTTAVMPENTSDLDFCIYGGVSGGRPVCKFEDSKKLNLQNVFKKWWEDWLRVRVRGYSYKENFECSPHEIFMIDEISVKYNQFHIMKKLNRKYISEDIMKVDVESETF